MAKNQDRNRGSDNRGSSKPEGRKQSQTGVMKDWTAMQFGEYLVRLVFGTLEAVRPKVMKDIAIGTKQMGLMGQAGIAGGVQLLTNVLMPFIPGKLKDPIEDLMANIPRSVTLVLREYQDKVQAGTTQMSMGDLNKLRDEMVTRIRSAFAPTLGQPDYLIQLWKRGQEDGIDYLERFLATAKQMDRVGQETLGQMLTQGQVDQLVDLFSMDLSDTRAFGEALSMIHPKGIVARGEEELKKVRRTTVTDDTLQQILAIWNPVLIEEGCQPITLPTVATPSKSTLVAAETITHKIVTPDQFTGKERRLFERN